MTAPSEDPTPTSAGRATRKLPARVEGFLRDAERRYPTRTLDEWLTEALRAIGPRCALRFESTELSGDALLERAERVAQQLASLGRAPGQPLGLCVDRSVDLVVGLLGTVLSGQAYVPIDPEQPIERLRAMLKDAGQPPVLATAATRDRLASQLPEVSNWQLLHDSKATPVTADVPRPSTPEQAVYTIFTSGSSGRPKGAMNSHRAVVNRLYWGLEQYPLQPTDRVLFKAPYSFDASVTELFWPLLAGAQVVLTRAGGHLDPDYLVRLIRERAITHLYFVPSMLRLFLQTPGVEQCHSLTHVLCAGEALPGALLRVCRQRLPQARVDNLYGPTEAAVEVSQWICDEADADAACVSIGRPLANARLYVVDAEGSALDVGETGELWIGGAPVGLGYVNRPELSAERFITDPFAAGGTVYRSGDLARWRADGALEYLGRIDQQIKLNGVRIEPEEIEAQLCSLSGVREAAVALIEGEDGAALLGAIVTPADGPLLTELRRSLSALLPSAMWPRRLLHAPALPYLPNGKLDRGAVAALLRAQAHPLPKPAPTEQLLLSAWREVLGQPDLGPYSHVFEAGAGSVDVLGVIARLRASGISELSVADLYDAPSVAAQLRSLQSAGKPPAALRATPTREPLAIIGMAVRAPGCPDLDAFWQAQLDGVDGIRHFQPQELDPGLPQSLRRRPNFVPARGILDDTERFDAALFGLSPREALLVDPQQRLLLELAWTTLEHAGVVPATAVRRDQRIGVWAGTAHNRHALDLREHAAAAVERSGELALQVANEKDYAALRIAHRLDLRGPAVSVHTACSTGLVAVVEAAEALWAGRCELALAGAATLIFPQRSGYLHVEGGMESADGRCRPFDAEASGTVFSEGAGMVLLKPLSRAQSDGDRIHAVLVGAGMNNDGGGKASFTAPSVAGQAACIRMALDAAGVSARQLGLIEAHGTATPLGDPIEVEALVRAFAADEVPASNCVLGSVKSNFGHTVAAAGVLGLIKAALCLQHERIPGTLHYQQPNPQIDFAQTPFRVSAIELAWPRGEATRHAGISSFGVGGTNAHALLAEAPPAAHAPESALALPLFALSARDEATLSARAEQLADWLQSQPQIALPAVQAVLTHGRAALSCRRVFVARDRDQLIAALRAPGRADTALSGPRLVFLFPGQGSQSPGMAAALYAELPSFALALDEVLAVLTPQLDIDLRALLLLHGDSRAAAALAETRTAQPALFAMEYALLRWLAALGLEPAATIGHSLGEYTAAVAGGVLSMQAAARAVCARAAAMWAQPRGGMLAVRAAPEALAGRLRDGIEIAGYNAPELTVVSGPAAAIDQLEGALGDAGLGVSRLQVSHGCHSAAMDGALAAVRAALSAESLVAPERRVYSCVSGRPLTAAEATEPDYWARQVRAPVQFTRAVAAELTEPGTVFVEVGPGQALSALLRQHRDSKGRPPQVLALLPPSRSERTTDPALHALQAVGRAFALGVPLTWPAAAKGPRPALPTYPFADTRFAITRSVDSLVAEPHPSPMRIATAAAPAESSVMADRRPLIHHELTRLLAEVAGLGPDELEPSQPLVEQGLDSLSLTQATLELERVFGIKLRFRRLMEDLDSVDRLTAFFDAELPPARFAPAAPVAAVQHAAVSGVAALAALQTRPTPLQAAAPNGEVLALIQQQMALMQQQLAVLAGASSVGLGTLASTTFKLPAAQAQAAVDAMGSDVAVHAAAVASAAAVSEADEKADLASRPFGASARITVKPQLQMSPAQRDWLDDFTARYVQRSGKSRAFSQQHRARMADPRVVTGFNPLWKDLVYPIVADRSDGARIWDIDGNEYIDLLSGFGANLLGYRPKAVIAAMHAQIDRGIEVGPQHPLAAEVAELISEFTGHARVGFCNTGSEAVMGAMRVARTVTGRKTIAIFTNSYHGIFDEVIVRGTRQLRSLSAAPGILANAVENVLVLDYASDAALQVLRERGHELAAIMIEPIQNKYPTLQPRAFVHALREICDAHGCALIFDEVVTGFRLSPGGAQQFYEVRADLCTYGKIIGGGLPFAAIAGSAAWMDALDGGHWQYGDDSYPEAGVTYFAGTFVRHPLALAAARASLLELKRGGQAFYDDLNGRTQGLIDRLNGAFAARSAPVKAVHCASLWRLQWDEDQKYISLFYYLARFHGLHLFEQFGHFVTAAMGEAEIDRIAEVFIGALDALTALGLIRSRDGVQPVAAPTPARLTTPTSASATRQRGPLSPGQAERWLAASFDENALRALDETFSLVLRGDIDRGVLEASLRTVCERHPAFRLRIEFETPTQVIDPQCHPRLEIIELDPAEAADAALHSAIEAAAQHRCALGRAPMAALNLIWVSTEHAVLHVVANHLVLDGWGASIFLSELAKAYRAGRAGDALKLPAMESPITFAEAECTRMAGPEGAAALRFWSERLRDPPPPLSLGDRTPGSRRSFAADTLQTRVEGALFVGLKAAAKRERCTLFQLLLSTTAVALQRLSGQSDFVLSLPYASQALGRHPSLLADGVLDLPIRIELAADDDARTLLPKLRATLMDALEQPLITQGLLARALKLPPLGNRPPLTGVFFNLNPRVDLSGFAPLQASMREGRKPGILGELIFNFYEETDSISLDLHHSSEFFSPARVGEIAQALQFALAEVAGSGAVTVPTPAAPSQITQPAAAALVAIAAQPCALPPPTHVLTMVRAQIAVHPQRTALRCGGQARNYAALGARIDAVAEALRAADVRPGDRVGLHLRRSLDLPAAMLGVFAAGAAYVPLDPEFPLGRLQHIADDAGLRVLLCDAPAELPEALARGRRCVSLAQVPATSHAAPGSFEADAEAAAYVLYTSGSTGKPKGVEVRQRNVASLLAAMQVRPGLAADDRMLAVTTPSFDISVLELLLPLTVGACSVIASEDEAKNPALLWPLLRRERCTHLQTTPSMLQMWLSDGELAFLAGCTVLLGGESLPATLASRVLPVAKALWNMYGPTETTVWSSCWRVEQPERGILIGEPIAGTRLYLLDSDLRPVADGAEGELCIGGLGVAAGYLHRPELNAERFVRLPGVDGPIYRSGDRAVLEAPERLRHLGRIDAQIKLRGHRIELGEIECVLAEQGEVTQAVVLVREDRPGDQRLIAYVVLNGGSQVDEVTLRERSAYSLPEYMVPQHILVLDRLPQLPNGKIDRKALPAPPQASAAGRPPADALEAEVAATLAELLGLPEIGMEQSFFALGGHSLLAIQLATRLNKMTGAALKMRDVFELGSAEKLARLIAAQRVDGVEIDELPPIVVLADPTQAPQSLMQARVFQLCELDPHRSTYNMPSAQRLRGPLDRTRLLGALKDFVAQQPSLRTRLLRGPQGLRQEISAQVAVQLPDTIDLRAIDQQDRERVLRERIEALINEPIGFDRTPLWRLALYRVDTEEHVLLLIPHHAIWDGWSFDIFYEAMAAALGEPPHPLPALSVSYGDFSAWHQQWLHGPGYQSQLAFWRARLYDLQFDALPADFSRSAPMSAAGESLMRTLPVAFVDGLHRRAREWEATPYMLLLAAFASSLQRASGMHELVIGTPVRGRSQPELESLVGYFVNLLVLPLKLDPEADLRSRVAAVKPQVVEAFAHADVQLEHLMPLLQSADRSRSGRLYQASFSFEDVRARPSHWGALQVTRLETTSSGVTEDLAVSLIETESGLHMQLSYSSARYRRETMQGLIEDLLQLLQALVAPQVPALSTLARPTLLGTAPNGPAALRQTAADTEPAPPVDTACSPLDEGDCETLLLELWSQLLPGARIDPDAGFFDQGGHSLMALAMINHLEARCGQRPSLVRIGQTSLRGLARELASRSLAEAEAMRVASASPPPLSWWQRLFERVGARR
jgi:amino acid adenylation domain-containing protein